MNEIKYDSLYSALAALNVALGGDEIKEADSTYTVVERLTDTLGFSEQTPMLLSTEEGSECPTTSIEIRENGEYNIDENTGFVGWNEVNVNIPNFEIPETELVSYTETLNFGDPFEFVIKCKKKDYLLTFLCEPYGEDVGGFSGEGVEESDEWMVMKFYSSRGIVKSGVFYIDQLRLWCKDSTMVYIPFKHTMEFTCNGGAVDLPESEWVEGTWGDPNQAIVCENIADFLTKPDSTKENPQWYEFICSPFTAPQVENLRMIVNDDSITEGDPLLNNRDGRTGLVINQSNNILASCGPMCMADGEMVDVWDIFPGDGNWCKIRTLKFTADQNYITVGGDIIVKQGTVFGGKFGDSPCAIILEKYETKP